MSPSRVHELAAGIGPAGYPFASRCSSRTGSFKAGLFFRDAGSICTRMNDEGGMRRYDGGPGSVSCRTPSSPSAPATWPLVSPRLRLSFARTRLSLRVRLAAHGLDRAPARESARGYGVSHDPVHVHMTFAGKRPLCGQRPPARGHSR